MRVGEKIIAVQIDSLCYGITQNKTYIITEPGENLIEIENDDGNIRVYYRSRFLTLSELREKKLKRIQ